MTSVKFGPFEVVAETGELWKSGRRLKLSGQAIQVLILLLESPSQVVSRDTLRAELWPEVGYGDFDHGLNAAVNRLREVLGDSAVNPRYIETVPRCGYRFVGKVHSPTPLPIEPAIETTVPKPAGKSRTLIVLSSVILLALTVVGVLILIALSRRPVLPTVNIVQVTSSPGYEFDPNFSPDGSQMVFAAVNDSSNRPNIYVKTIGDEKTLQLTQGPGDSSCPEWSPDGKAIAYTHRVEDVPGEFKSSIYIMSPLGGSKRKILQIHEFRDGRDCFVSWSPDAKWIAYADTPPQEPTGIFVTSDSGAFVRRVTAAPKGSFDSVPAFSPNGKWIAFVRNTDDGGKPAIFLVAANEEASGPKQRKIAELRGITRLAWTGDGNRIVFSGMGFFAGENSLFSVQVSGGAPERLQVISSDAASPAISRRGDKLAYASEFFDPDIWKTPRNPNAASTKLVSSTRMEAQPNLSPDGTKLTFISNRDGVVAVWTSNADGSDPVRLSRGGGGTPEWSPDGKQVLFDSNDGGHWHLCLAAAEGGNEVHFGDRDSDRRAPSWSADGKSIYFSSNRSGTYEIWRTSLQNSSSVQVTHSGAVYAQESRDGKVVYFQKLKHPTRYDFDLVPQIWSVPAKGGPENLVFDLNEEPSFGSGSWFWRVMQNGIYFVDNSAKPKSALKYFDFKTRRISRIRALETWVWGGPGLAIASDEQTFFLSHVESVGSDIMMAENFR